MKAVHQYDSRDNHRLGVSSKVKGDLTKDGPFKFGKWVSYQTPALVERDKTTLICCTDYYTGSAEFPKCDTVYIVSESGYTAAVEVDVPREE